MCLIYLFCCKACWKQYTGKTTERSRYRWNNHQVEARMAESGDWGNVKQKFLRSPCLQDDHKGFLNMLQESYRCHLRFWPN